MSVLSAPLAALAPAPRPAPRRLCPALARPFRSYSLGIVVALAITSLVVVALLHVWVRLEVIRIGYALSQQTRLHQALLQHNQRLRLELATRKDPATVERIARERLHMALPESSTIRLLARSPSPAAARHVLPHRESDKAARRAQDGQP